MTIPISNMEQIWTNGSTSYNAISMNVVTGGQASDSTILKLKSNGTLQFTVDYGGNTSIPTGNVYMKSGSMYIVSGNIVIGDASYWGDNA